MTYKLSICIPTLNRGRYIGETLESIVSQLRDSVEIVIVDGGSTDGTEQIVGSYQQVFPNISYVRRDTAGQQPSNEGFSRDCNHAVELAKGTYCWLMTDDDLLMPGAIEKVLSEIENGYPVIVAGVEVRNEDLTRVLIPRRPDLSHDQIYQPSEWNHFAAKVGGCLTFVGAVIIKRQFWLSRNREKYFSSGFIHVGVIFDESIRDNVLVIAGPLVSVRHGNAHWSTRTFQIWMFNWPQLVWSFSTISDGTKQILAPKEGWRKLSTLVLMRALGTYSLKEYQLFLFERLQSKGERIMAKLIAGLPRSLLYIPAYMYLCARGSETSTVLFELKNSWRRGNK